MGKSKNADFLRGQVYQARYNLKMVKLQDSPGILEYMVKMFSPDQLVHITKASHLPVTLLHKKFYNPESHVQQTKQQLKKSLEQVKDEF